MIKEKIKVESIINPGLVVFGNQKYILPNMIKVDMNFSLNDIDWVKPSYIKSDGPLLENKEWSIKSSKGLKSYIIKRQNNDYTCSCPGYGFRRTCRHIDEVKNK